MGSITRFRLLIAELALMFMVIEREKDFPQHRSGAALVFLCVMGVTWTVDWFCFLTEILKEKRQ